MSVNIKDFTDRTMELFKEISNIERKSGEEEEIAKHLDEFFRNIPGVEVHRQQEDPTPPSKKKINNLIVCKPGSIGYENLPPIALQAHIDMVCQPASANFSEGVATYMEGDLMKGKSAADGKTKTTLGADDGIGVACIMAIFERSDLSHPPLEAILTSDEEDGMSGADKLKIEKVKSERLINIDTETEGKFFYGCAGGVYAHLKLDLHTNPAPGGLVALGLTVSGLLGGHSGIEIDKHRANANRLIGRLLEGLRYRLAAENISFYMINVNGGSAHNVITVRSDAQIAVPGVNVEAVKRHVDSLAAGLAADYPFEAEMKVSVGEINLAFDTVLDEPSSNAIIRLLREIPNGVVGMHKKVAGLVETSCNMGVVECKDGVFILSSFVRSSDENEKTKLANRIKTIGEGIGAKYSDENNFPEWNPNPGSLLKAFFEARYKEVFGDEAETLSIHAGLECGYFAQKRPSMDIIAIGPTITGAHTIEETLNVPTVEKVAKLLLDVLEHLDGTETQVSNTAPSKRISLSGHTHSHDGHICAR